MKKEKVLTEDEITRRETLKRRMFYILVGVDALLVVYLIIQIALLFK